MGFLSSQGFFFFFSHSVSNCAQRQFINMVAPQLRKELISFLDYFRIEREYPSPHLEKSPREG